MSEQNNDEFMFVFDPTTIDLNLLANIYLTMKQECEEFEFKRIPIPKNKSSHQFQ